MGAVRSVFLAVLATAPGLATAGCHPEPAGRPNVLVITIDTLRADHLGVAGYAPAHTPNLDRLAQEGWLFADAMAPAPLTLPSHSSLFTGLLPAAHGVRDNEPFALRSEVDTLAEILQRAGYQTGAVIGGEPLKRGCGLEQGFEEYDAPEPNRPGSITFRERTAGEVAAAGIAWIDRARSPFFLWLHFFDPHAPYSPPEAFRQGHAYDGEVAYVDAEVGRVLAHLARLGVNDRTLVVVASDHGESLGEHGEATHGFLVYQSTLRVPIVFRGPGVPRGRRDSRVARLIDVLPTTLQLVGLPTSGACQGTSLLSADPGPAFGESLYTYHHFGWAQLTCVRRGASKRIEGPQPESYDLGVDPDEQSPLSPGADTLTVKVDLARLRDLEWTPTDQAASLLAPVGYLGSPPPRGGLRFLSQEDNLGRRATSQSMQLVQGFLQGVEAAGGKQWNRALVSLRSVLQHDPSNPAFRWWTARALEHCGMHERDAALLRQAITVYDELASEGHTDAFNLGLKLRCHELVGLWSEAVARGDAALRAGTGNADTRHVLGLILTDPHNPLRDVPRGNELLQQAQRSKPR